jgi:ABC-type antimicrobial peptide transport system permease subunit
VSIGVYGVISYTVERQTQEIGIRLALGAQRQGILQRVVGEASALAGVGVVVGTVGGLAVSRTMSSVLYGVQSNDPVTFASVLPLSPLWRCWLAIFPLVARPKSIPWRRFGTSEEGL